MYVGNDVVDLGDPQIAFHHLRARFLERVLCIEERIRLARARDPRRLLWCLFAAKEAAYKVLARRSGAAAPMEHRRYRVSPSLDRVDTGSGVLALKIESVGDRVHAVAHSIGVATRLGIARLAPGADGSLAARTLLCAALAAPLVCAAADLQVARSPLPGSWDGYGPPVLLRRGIASETAISLSHDGRFAA